MQLHAGTSGFAYKGWKGPFYPEKCSDKDLLRLYAERLSVVEVNNTFYRMPKPELLRRWAEQVPDRFVFVLKAPQRITHHRKLQECADDVAYFWQCAQELRTHLGPVLFQLPPYLRCDLDVLRGFLGGLPSGMRAAFEFRHGSWNDEAVTDALGSAGAALVTADTDEDDAEIVPTADWGYLRLRKTSYDDDALQGWAERIAAQPWREAFAFLKHEDEGAAPRMALRLLELAK